MHPGETLRKDEIVYKIAKTPKRKNIIHGGEDVVVITKTPVAGLTRR